MIYLKESRRSYQKILYHKYRHTIIHYISRQLNKKVSLQYHDGKIEHIIKENVRLIAVNDFYIYTQDINGVCVIYDKTTHQQVKTVSISLM